MRVRRFVRGLCRVVLPGVVGALAGALSVFFFPPIELVWIAVPVVSASIAALCARVFLSPRAYRRSKRFVRRVWEKRADAIAASSKRACLGNIRLYKKDILVTLLKGGDIESLRTRIFEDKTIHPSDGSRLQFFLDRI